MEGIPPIYFNLYCMHILINVQAFCAVLKKIKKHTITGNVGLLIIYQKTFSCRKQGKYLFLFITTESKFTKLL